MFEGKQPIKWTKVAQNVGLPARENCGGCHFYGGGGDGVKHGDLDFKTAVTLHTGSALTLLLLWVFAIFWHLTTGTWRHYVPTSNGLLKVAKFYAFGIFRGERHPYRKAYWPFIQRTCYADD